jgi:hypothetical protein
MLPLKSRWRVRLLSLATLCLLGGLPMHAEDKKEQEPEEFKPPTAEAKEVEALGTASKLLEYGVENKKPEAVATAVIMLVDNNVTGKNPVEPLLPYLKTVLAEARKAKTAAAHAALLDAAEEKLKELTSREVKGGGITKWHRTLLAGQTDVFSVAFVGGPQGAPYGQVTLITIPANGPLLYLQVKDGDRLIAASYGNSISIQFPVVAAKPGDSVNYRLITKCLSVGPKTKGGNVTFYGNAF